MPWRANHSHRMTVRAVAFALVVVGVLRAHAQDVSNDGRMKVTVAHPTILDELSGAPYFWFDYQSAGVKSYRIAFPNLIYQATSWLQGWGGLIVTWRDSQASA